MNVTAACIKAAWKNVVQHVKNKCNGYKKYGRQRSGIRQVQGTCARTYAASAMRMARVKGQHQTEKDRFVEGDNSCVAGCCN